MKKLLCENGRETEWKREIERGTVVKTPCWLALQDSKVIWSVERKMRNKDSHWCYLYTNQSRFKYQRR